MSLENWQNALLAFKKTLKQDNKFIEAYNNLGVTYSHLGENDKAIENYKKYIKKNILMKSLVKFKSKIYLE